MVPFLQEFKVGVKKMLGNTHKGDYAIIMGLNTPRALLVQIDGVGDGWVHGRVMFPKTRFPDLTPTFSRKVEAECVEMSLEHAAEMVESYESMFIKHE